MGGARIAHSSSRSGKSKVKSRKFLKRFVLGVMLFVSVCSGFACKKKQDDISVYLPDGAPAIALAGAMHEDTANDGVCYNVVKADVITSCVSYENESKNADICVLPVSAASKILGSGERYKLMATLTHGNLYLISKNGETLYTKDNLTTLIGKKVGVLQMNAVPGLTFKATLDKYQIPYAEWKNTDEIKTDAVNLKAVADMGAESGDLDCYLVAEPQASVFVKKSGYTLVGDLQSLYGGEKGYPQAVAVVKSSLLQEKETSVKEVFSRIEQSCAWAKTASGDKIVSAVNAHMADESQETSLKAPLLTADVLARCGVRYESAYAEKETIRVFLTALKGVNANAVGEIADGFFWDLK